MKMAPEFSRMKFEPHGGYGTSIDGEPMPFGYISQEGYGKPVFELSPVLSHDEDKLTALALIMAAAPELLEALKDALSLLSHHYPNPAPRGEISRGRTALAKATNSDPAALSKSGA